MVLRFNFYILDVIFKLRWIFLGAYNMIKDLLLFSCFYFKHHCIDYRKTGTSPTLKESLLVR